VAYRYPGELLDTHLFRRSSASMEGLLVGQGRSGTVHGSPEGQAGYCLTLRQNITLDLGPSPSIGSCTLACLALTLLLGLPVPHTPTRRLRVLVV
jgi:hypothetical protein